MIRTRVGYAGGVMKDPGYHDLGDHSEAVQIDFDPSRISYGDLVDVFWKGHDPARGSWSRQYRAAIFYHGEEQRKLAEETRDHLASATGHRIFTAIEPYAGFYLAEDYHQKHSLRLFSDLMAEFRTIYPNLKDLINSTAVSRVNGYLGGYGRCESLQKEIEGLGLSPGAREELLSVVCGRKTSVSCPAG